jgi:hypothetical protein
MNKTMTDRQMLEEEIKEIYLDMILAARAKVRHVEALAQAQKEFDEATERLKLFTAKLAICEE